MYRQFKYMIKSDTDEETFNRVVEMARRGEFDHDDRRDERGTIVLGDMEEDEPEIYVYTGVTIMSIDCASAAIITKPNEYVDSPNEFPHGDRTGLGVWQHMFIMMPDGTELRTSWTDDFEIHRQLAEYLFGGDLPEWATPGTETAVTVEPEDIVF